jgi:hypothetical protein
VIRVMVIAAGQNLRIHPQSQEDILRSVEKTDQRARFHEGVGAMPILEAAWIGGDMRQGCVLGRKKSPIISDGASQ